MRVKMSLQTNKTLGCIGALLILFSIFTPTIIFLPIILSGIILVLISLLQFAKFYKDKEIYNNTLYGILSTILGAVTTFIIIAATPIGSILKNNVYRYVPDWNGNYANLIKGIITNWFHILGDTINLQIGVLLLSIFWVFLIITMIFIRKVMKKLAKHSHTNMFATTGTMLIMGAAIPIIGLICIWLSTTALAFAFFDTKEPKLTPPVTTIEQTQPPTPPSETELKTDTPTKRYCPYCGNPSLPENIFCSHCGKQK